jgi:hypothetical protein
VIWLPVPLALESPVRAWVVSEVSPWLLAPSPSAQAKLPVVLSVYAPVTLLPLTVCVWELVWILVLSATEPWLLSVSICVTVLVEVTPTRVAVG